MNSPMAKDTGSERIIFVYDDIFCRVDMTRDELRGWADEDWEKVKILLEKKLRVNCLAISRAS